MPRGKKKVKIVKVKKVKEAKVQRLIALRNVDKRKAEGWKVIEESESTPDLVLMEK